MAIALLLFAAVVLTAAMLALTLGVNELEKKGAELSGVLRRRYAVKPAPTGKGPAGAAAAPAVPGGAAAGKAP